MQTKFVSTSLSVGFPIWLLLALGNSAIAADYHSIVLQDAPEGYWRLGETSPVVATNIGSLGTNADGAYIGSVQDGLPGAIVNDPNTAASFDGTDGKIDIPYNNNLNPSSAFTIECWANVAGGDGNYRSPLSSRDDTPPGNTKGYILYATSGNMWSFWTGQGGGWHTLDGPPVVNGEWAHLVGTFDGVTKSLFVNGVLVAIGRAASFQANNQRVLRIGAGATETAGNFFFNGLLDEVAVYTNVLSNDRILLHYQTGSGNNPVATVPVVVTDPQGLTNYIHQPVAFTVSATGSLPFAYQWKKNGANLPGATNATYVIPSAQVTDSGAYSVDITNDGGVATSAEATLEVLNISVPEIVQQPQAATVYAGSTAHLMVVATGSADLQYQWQFNGANLSNQTNAILVIPNVQTTNQGDYLVKVTDAAGTTTSSTAKLTILVLPPRSYAAIIMTDQPVAYWRLDEASGEVATDYAGGFNGAYMNGVTLGVPGALVGDTDTAAEFITDNQNKVEVPYSRALNPTNFTIECWAKVTGGDGTYRSPLTSRSGAPTGGYIFYASQGNLWEFWTGVGAGWDTIAGPPVENGKWTYLAATYDGKTKSFYVNGVPIGSNTNSMLFNQTQLLRIGAGATDDPTGQFFFYGDIDEVAVYNTALTADRITAHYGAGLGSTTPPTISVQPISRAVLAGQNVSFSVVATGSLPLQYQWQFKGTNLPNATNAILNLNNVQSANAGDYRAVVNNTVGTANSDPATLTVVTIPTISYKDLILGDGPVSFWRLDETNSDTATDLLGAHNGTYLNGVILGQPGAIVGDSDASAGFVVTNQTKVDVDYSPDLNTAQFTAECWAQVTGAANNYRSPLTSRADLPQRGYIFYAANNNLWQFWTGKGDTTGWDSITGPAVQLGQWVHLVATYDGVIKRFFVNGVQVGSSTAAFAPNDESVLRIGGGASESPTGNYFFQGNVDEVAYYNKPLSAVQILTHYALGAKPVTAPPTLSFLRNATGIVLTWSAGTLQQTEQIPGSWSDVPGTSPLTVTPTEKQRFYRVKQ